MRKRHTYIVTIVLILASVTSCFQIDEKFDYKRPSKATIVCERTVSVIQEYMIFVDIVLMFNEYLKTGDDYKPLLLESHMKGWGITPDGNNWSITLQGRRYTIYPGAKPINEVGSEWRIARFRNNDPIEGSGRAFDLCYIRCNNENIYDVESEEIITSRFDREVYNGPVNMVVERLPKGDRFLLEYSIEALGEYHVKDSNNTASELRRAIVKYKFEGECAKFDYSYMRVLITSGKAEIKSGKAEATESELDDIKLIYSNSNGNYGTMDITLNGERVEGR